MRAGGSWFRGRETRQQMIIDLRSAALSGLPPDAVVVVGAGAAGIALSRRLSAAKRPVILLESGADDHNDAGLRDLNAGAVTGLAYQGLADGRSRVLGGTTALWHGQCMRLHDIDLRQRAWIPHSGWPFAPDVLDRPYAQAEEWLQVSGRGYGPERWAEHPKLAPVDWDPEYLLHDFTEYTHQPMLARVHRAALEQDPLLHVLLNATVAAVTVDARAVTGVQVIDADGARTTLPAGEIVLAAGAIENARILQLSDPEGIGLGTGRRHTGRYLQDHPIVRTAQVLSDDYRLLQDRYVALHRGRRRLFPKVRLAPSSQERHELLDATAVFVHDHDQPGLLAARRLVLAARAREAPEHPWRDALTALQAPVPVVRDTFRRYARGLSTASRPSAVWLQLWLEQVPDPASRVTLSTATDRFGLRRPVVDWRAADQEIETSRRMTRWIAADLERLGLARVRELAPMHDDDAWRAGVTDAYHPAGTTRMSRDPHDGVVDPDLQVHGVRGLSVVGGSVFPVAGYANPTLTIVALALRLGDRLAARTPVHG